MKYTAFVILLLAFSVQAKTIHDEEHVQYWTQTLETHALVFVRKNAARNLGKIGDLQALPSLIKALEDKAHEVRLEAAKSLGLLGDESAIPVLEDTAQNDQDRQVRRRARWSIQKIRAHQEFIQKKLEKLKAESKN